MLLAVIALCCIPFCSHAQKEKIEFDTSGKKLYLLTQVEIDTAALYAKKAKAVTKKQKLIDALALVNAEIDTANAQIKTARKLMTGKKGNGNNKKPKEAETPPVIVPVAPVKPTTKPKPKKN